MTGCATLSGSSASPRPPVPSSSEHFDEDFLKNLPLEPSRAPADVIIQDNCLEPENGVWAPYGPDQRTLALKQHLFSRIPANVILHVVSRPSFSQSWMIALTEEESQGPTKAYRLNLVEADGDLWTSEVPSHVVESLRAAWNAALSTATYVRSGCRGCRLDGAVYSFWSDNMAGYTHSPAEGSFAREVVRLSDALRTYLVAPKSGQMTLERKLKELARDIVSRQKQGVPCTESQNEDPPRAPPN